ncbi:MAG TPA: D-alanyl-D-alanine carboxypeptidase/D-alanyl-D-alanine-endopeptidase [Chitinophagaceae bacterium]
MLNSHLKTPYLVLLTSYLLVSCSVQKQIAKSAKADVISTAPFKAAHLGISVYEPATGKYWYDYQGDKYFVPASNTKIPTCYAAMKYLGDSLIAFTYDELPDRVYIQPNGDPSFLLPEFKNQGAFNFLNKLNKPINIDLSGWKSRPLGSGWTWNDYEATYMAERSAMPIYGNVISFSGQLSNPKIFPAKAVASIKADSINSSSFLKEVHRGKADNDYMIVGGGKTSTTQELTFDTENSKIIARLLSDTLKIPVSFSYPTSIVPYKISPDRSVKSQPTDSLLKPMMHRSDNFFAEQSLLMVSNKLLGVMNDSKIIDTLLKTDFKDLPQKPRWADGSGLSRYNLFTPQDFVAILNKMQKEFPMERIKTIFATGGEGTISSYYKADSGYIYAKTGTLSGVVAFSGFLYTKKGKLLIFSTLVNNHQANVTDIRRAIEKFLKGIRSRY